MHERVKKLHMWVLLPALSFPLWNRGFLEGIANSIGSFVVVEDDFQHTFEKRMAKILVEMEIYVGLLTNVEILCHERLFSQRLD